MKSYLAFTKKEFTEQIRSYKLLILLVVFFIFGMLSPLLAKLTPEILKSVDMQGIELTLPDPTYIDGYTQFFKNINQMGIIALIVIFGGLITQEVNKGTLINVLSKGLSRKTVILSKFTAATVSWTLAYVLSVVTNYIYITYLFKSYFTKELAFSLAILWLFGVFVIALSLFSGVIVRNNYGGLLVTAIVLGALLIIDIFPKTYKYSPIALASKNMDIINGTITMSSLTLSIIITGLLTIILMLSTIIIFNKKKV